MKQPCRCGRRWWARWYGRNAGYAPICSGCQKPVRDCTCRPLQFQDLPVGARFEFVNGPPGIREKSDAIRTTDGLVAELLWMVAEK